jgi:hypothetical protein
MRIAPEIEGASIVLLGSFNPRLFRPEWFSKSKIIGEKEADSARVEIIHEQIAIFALDWCQIRVEQNRFQIELNNPPLIRAHDLVLKTFKEFLSHTPIYKLGLNRHVHFNVRSFETRDAIGAFLAPKEPWGDWAPKMKGSERILRGGMRNLTMVQRDREDGYKGEISATVQPSARLIERGIFVTINDHYELGDEASITGTEKAMEVVEKFWEPSMERADHIIDLVMALEERVKRDD